MNLENSVNDHKRIVQSDRTIHNYNPEPEQPKAARLFRPKNKRSIRKSRILPTLLSIAGIAIAATAVGYTAEKATEYVINDIQDSKAEQTYSQMEAKYASHEKDGTITPYERYNFLLRVIKGKALVRSPGELPVYSDGRVISIEDLAAMAEALPKK